MLLLNGKFVNVGLPLSSLILETIFDVIHIQLCLFAANWRHHKMLNAKWSNLSFSVLKGNRMN